MLSRHDLPVEVLAHIFTLVQEPRTRLRALRGSLRWIPSICHVCRRWRSIAISTPLLWNTIVSRGWQRDRSWIPIALERAAGAPLEVLVDIWSHTGPSKAQIVRETLELLLPHSSTFRTVEFEFDSHHPNDDPSLLALVSRSLVLMTKVVGLHLIHLGEWASSPLPFDAADFNQSGSLRYLTLAGVYTLPWSSPAYTSLRSLDLQSISSPPDVEKFLDILRACPELERLNVVNCDFPDRQTASSSGAVVALPNMRVLSLTGHSRVFAYLADRIEVSAACKVIGLVLHLEDGVDTTHVYSQFRPASLYRSILPLLETLVLSYSSEAGFASHGTFGGGHQIHLEILPENFTLPPLSLAAWNAWLRPFSALSAKSLVHFRILYPGDPLKELTEEMWTAALASFPCLDSIELESTTLVGELQPPIENTDILRVVAALEASGLCAPRLRNLTFVSVMIDDSIVDPIVRMLERRAERGAVPLEKLILEYQERQFNVEHLTVVRNLQEQVAKLGLTVSSTYVQVH